jgi:beta-ribofuranosylaminobenzene 5'-phosphate synthase
VTPKTTTTAAIRVTAPARLHLGFLDLNGEIGRRFGSIGLSVDQPVTRLTIARAEQNSASGPESNRVIKLLSRFAGNGAAAHYAVSVEEAIPAHSGLGSGTQLALAVGAGIARLEGRMLSPNELAKLGDRGARSGIGLAAFMGGGLLIDGGRGSRDIAPPVTLRADFPDAWRALLILDRGRAGVSGAAEAKAFAGLPPFDKSSAAHICHLVLMKLVPGLKEGDIAAFGSAVTEIQDIVGGHFASKQGGSPWSSPAVGRIAEKMRVLGATGIGQSSWGPTGVAFAESQVAADRLYHSLVDDAKASGLDIVIARGRNSGARFDPA